MCLHPLRILGYISCVLCRKIQRPRCFEESDTDEDLFDGTENTAATVQRAPSVSQTSVRRGKKNPLHDVPQQPGSSRAASTIIPDQASTIDTNKFSRSPTPPPLTRDGAMRIDG